MKIFLKQKFLWLYIEQELELVLKTSDLKTSDYNSFADLKKERLTLHKRVSNKWTIEKNQWIVQKFISFKPKEKVNAKYLIDWSKFF